MAQNSRGAGYQVELDAIFSARKLTNRFQAILGTPPAKDKLLAKIIADGGFDPARVLMVGDGETDLQAARENGTLFFGRGIIFREPGLPCAEHLSELTSWVKKFMV